MSYQQEIINLQNNVTRLDSENKELKENKMDAVITKDKQSSIEVSRNAKGDYAFKVKTYYSHEDEDSENIVVLNKNIMVKLMAEFD